MPDHITLCWNICYGAFERWRGAAGKSSSLAYLFFDRNEPFYKDFKAKWLSMRTPPEKISVSLSSLGWDMIADIQEVDMDRHPPIQVADMIAWGRTRNLHPEKTGAIMDDVLKRYIPMTWATVTEQKLREKYPKP